MLYNSKLYECLCLRTHVLHMKIRSAVGDGEQTPVGFVNESGYFVDLPELGDKDLFRIEKISDKYELTRFTLDEIINTYDGELLKEKGVRLSRKERETYFRVLSALTDESLGPIHFLLEDGEIEEIMVNGIGEPIFIFHRKFGMLPTNLSFESEEYFMEVANRALRPLGRRVDAHNQRNHGILPNLDRISVVVPPYSKRHAMSIRRFSVRPLTVPDIIRSGTLDVDKAVVLWELFASGSTNIGIVGNTGAGKTTLLNALLRFLPVESRVICVEETPEIRPPQKQVVQFVSNQKLGIKDAIEDTLRLRPDRVVVGEIRSDAEVRALIESCLAGQALGTYFTYHAESADFALKRMKAQGVREDELEALGFLVVCKRYQGRKGVVRKVTDMFDVKNNVKLKPKKADRKKKDFLEKFRGTDQEFIEEVAGWG